MTKAVRSVRGGTGYTRTPRVERYAGELRVQQMAIQCDLMTLIGLRHQRHGARPHVVQSHSTASVIHND
jgi:hypothetical protein